MIILLDKLYRTLDIEIFSQVNVAPIIKNNHTFGCPFYALTNCIKSRGRQTNWEEIVRLGINLGPSLRHAGLLALVLKFQTRKVSLKYHIQFNIFFETGRLSAGNLPTFLLIKTLYILKIELMKSMRPTEG